MRTIVMTILALTFAASGTPADALQPSDTMKAWKGASAEERADLLAQLLDKGTSDGTRAKIRDCLDETSRIPGHADLDIGQVVTFCSKGAAGQPV